jgi:hypothetical protein
MKDVHRKRRDSLGLCVFSEYLKHSLHPVRLSHEVIINGEHVQVERRPTAPRPLTAPHATLTDLLEVSALTE